MSRFSVLVCVPNASTPRMNASEDSTIYTYDVI